MSRSGGHIPTAHDRPQRERIIPLPRSRSGAWRLMRNPFRRSPRDVSGRTLAQRETARQEAQERKVASATRSAVCRIGNHELCRDEDLSNRHAIGCLCVCHDEAFRP